MWIAVIPWGAAAASTAQVTLTAGSLNFLAVPGGVAFSSTLNGYDTSATTSLAMDINDATGSGAGWNVTLTSTLFTTGPQQLGAGATVASVGPSATCDAGAQCTPYSPSVSVVYPYSVPAGATAPTATKVIGNAADAGMGPQTLTTTFTLALPGGAYSGDYVSAWTISLVAGP